MKRSAVIVWLAEAPHPDTSVCVRSSHRDNPSALRQLVPVPQRGAGPVEQPGERLGLADGIGQQCARERPEGLVPPLAVPVQPFEAANRRIPGAPLQSRLQRVRMRGNRESAQPRDILDDVAPFSAQPIRGRRKTERNNVAVLGADFDRVDAQYALEVLRWVRLASGVAVVGQYDEVEAGPRRGNGDRTHDAGAIRAPAVDVNRAAHRHCELSGSWGQRAGMRR